MTRIPVPKQLQRGRTKDELEARRSALALLAMVEGRVGSGRVGSD